jgi:dUTP pyrophosphatase
MTPFQAYTGTRPTAKSLRIFGCPVVTRLPGRRPAKLDPHTATGVFLGYTATENNIYFRDNATQQVKVATHVTFDEAGFILPRSMLSPTQRALQDAGYDQLSNSKSSTSHEPTDEKHHHANASHDTLYVQRLSNQATIPVRSSTEAAGLDLFSATDILIPPHTPTKVPTDIAIKPPPGTYCQILSRSGMLLNQQIEAKAGTIDSDYTGNVQVILHNNSEQDYYAKRGDRVAQLITYHISQPTPTDVQELPATVRGTHGFGSTGINATDACIRHVNVATSLTLTTDPIQQSDGIKPYNIWLSTDPFLKRLSIQLDVKGDHPTLGLPYQDTSSYMTWHRVHLPSASQNGEALYAEPHY